MENPTFLFFKDKQSEAISVRAKIIQDSLYLYDNPAFQGNQLSVPLKKCSYTLVDNIALIYLGRGENYIVVPSDSAYYLPLVTMIGNKNKHTGFSKKWYTIAGGVVMLLLITYLFFAKVVPIVVLNCITTKQEIKIGNSFYKSFIAETEVDTAQSIVIQNFADRLHLSTKYPIRVTVLKDTIANAFAFPGGHIVVYSGILNKMEKPQELVALLAHESSHVNNRHSLQLLSSNISTAVLIGVITQGGGFTKMIINNANNLRELSYSRELEMEADNDGMKLMVNNNINPLGMKWLMEDLRKLDDEMPSSISFLSTHPLTDERIKNATDYCNKYKYLKAPMDSKELLLWDELKKGEE